jgi:hypothetical protein
MIEALLQLGAGAFSLLMLLTLLGCALFPLLPELPDEDD